MLAESYTVAGAFPVKLLQASDLMRDGRLIPYHLQINPTSKCNAHCSWCSCSEAAKDTELSYAELANIIEAFVGRGTRAITLSGGGEPTLHSELLCLITEIHYEYHVHIGIATNGIRWAKGHMNLEEVNECLDWCRISVAEIPDAATEYPAIITKVAKQLPDVDIGVSVVLDKSEDLATAQTVCKACDKIANISHVRFRENIIKPNTELFAEAQERCHGASDKIIWQQPTASIQGATQCRLPLVRPVIDSDGWVYPCCGAQYATDEVGYMPELFKMCRWEDYQGDIFDGSICNQCYYSSYNDILAQYVKPVTHGEFV